MRRRVLLVTPVMPRHTGSGLARRAAMTLAALARDGEVDLVVVPVAGGEPSPPDHVLREAARIHVLSLQEHLDPHIALIARLTDPLERARAMERYPKPYLARFCTAASAAEVFDWARILPPSVVHVMRLYLAPLADPFLRLAPTARPEMVLDLDDDELETRTRLAGLHRLRGEDEAARQEERERGRYETYLHRYLAAFDRVSLANPADAERIGREFPSARTAVVPNGVLPPDDAPVHEPSSKGPLRLLFVGTLDYLPNADAVEFLCTAIRAALHDLFPRKIAIDIVGAVGGHLLDRFGCLEDVRLHGYAPSLASFYAAADVAIVPIRAGGGTRLKILEAFAHRVPVVSTALGAEGLGAIDDGELLIGDCATSIARACLRIKSDPALARQLACRAGVLVAQSHGLDAVVAALRLLRGRSVGA
jgi:glycosyltransferase involved in cell wall biosynthesis